VQSIQLVGLLGQQWNLPVSSNGANQTINLNNIKAGQYQAIFKNIKGEIFQAKVLKR
jgi:hypothetical protein